MLLFENRKLKKQLQTAWDRQDEMLEANRELREKIATAHADLEAANSRQNEQDKKIRDLEKQVLEASKTIREQTGADLLVNALRELGVVPKPRPDYDAFEQQQRLNDQMARAQAMGNAARPSSGMSHLGNSLLGGAVR